MLYGDVVELALYHPDHGFYASGGSAGRRGDFITSPEVGPLFGHVLANAIDTEWRRLGEPDRFVVIDWGAGPGTLVRSILAAEPSCSEALELVAVERSASQRGLHPMGVTSVADVSRLDFGDTSGVIIANELLDNLAFSPIAGVENDLYYQVIDVDDAGALVTSRGSSCTGPKLSPGASRGIDQTAAAQWLTDALTVLSAGRVIVFDYARELSDEVAIRTYAAHGVAGDPLTQLGTKDVTVDVDIFQLQARVRPADQVSDQASWLRRHGLDELVEQGRQLWEAQAAAGSLEALKGRSRLREAEALTDLDGLGGFTVLEWAI